MRLAAVHHGRAAHLHLQRRAVLARGGDLESQLLARQRARVPHAIAGQHRLVGLRQDDVRGHDLLAAVAAHRRVGRVDLDGPVVGVAQHQGVGRRVEDRAVLLLAVAQSPLGALALRDVAPDVQHVRLAAVLDRHAAQFQVVLPAVAPPQLGVQRDRLAGERPLVQRTDRLPHLGRIGQHAVHAQHFRARIAAHRLVGRVDVDDAEIGVAQHQRVDRGVEDRAVLLLAVAQRLVGAPALADVAQVAHEDLALGHGGDADRDFHRKLAAVRAQRRGLHQSSHQPPAVMRPEIPDSAARGLRAAARA